MKKNIHPPYGEITVTMTDGTQFTTRSTSKKKHIHLDVDPLNHHAWTKGRRNVSVAGGRADKFLKKYQNSKFFTQQEKSNS